jgi:nitrite reductase (NO-forming)
MWGAILIEPAGGLQPPADHEFYIGQSEWYLAPAGNNDPDGVTKGVLKYDGDAEGSRAFDELPNYYSFNGHQGALTDPTMYGDSMVVAEGELVRLFVANAGPNKISSFHVIGVVFDRVYLAHPADFARGEETVALPAGSAGVFEFVAPSIPGTYKIVDHSLSRVGKGAIGYIKVE